MNFHVLSALQHMLFEWVVKMEFSENTKHNIEKTTGVPFSELLDKKIQRDPRLEKLERPKKKDNLDLLVRGNPQLTLGRITTIDEVEEYFSNKLGFIKS
jgi:hypothetical protein